MVGDDIILKYDLTSGIYDELYRDEQFGKYRFLFFEKNLGVRNRILDIGCGTGLLMDFLKENGIDKYATYICLEPSRRMLKYAVGKNRDDQRIVFINAYCEDKLFLHNYFDQIFMITVLDAVHDKIKCLHNAVDYLKIGGQLIVSLIPKAVNKITLSGLLSQQNIRIQYLGEHIDVFYLLTKHS